MTRRAVIVGGGAAGLLCAGFSARHGLDVTVVEARERPARKILVTGKGRCNLTNNCTPEEFLQNVRSNPKFLYSAIHAFPPRETMAFFESLGVSLKTERGRRVFPVSDRAMDIADALTGFCRREGVRILYAKAADLLLQGGSASGVRLEDGRELAADMVLLSTGGKSYPQTGSDGSGYGIAARAGHTVTPLRPSLVPVLCADGFCGRLAGLTLKNVSLTLYNKKGRALFSELGEMLFTHQGVSGPLVLSASTYMDDDPREYRLVLDLKPGLSPEQLDARLVRDLSENPNKELETLAALLLPRALAPIVLGLAGIPPRLRANQLTRPQRRTLAQALKAFPLEPLALGSIEEAVVTAGGVSVREVRPADMASRLVPGLFFAGEILDIDCFTGGYNLQAAFSTGFCAARGMAEYAAGKPQQV